MGKSGSSSQANQATTTQNADNRIVNESGIVAQGSTLGWSSNVTTDDDFWSNVSTTTIDNSVNTSSDPATVKAAFDFATNTNAINGQGLTSLLKAASELTSKTQDSATTLASRFQDGIAQAFDTGRNTTPGGIDNKTMIILGVAAAGAVAVYAMNKGR